MKQETQFKIAWCPVCNQGWVEVVKDLKTNELFLCCMECETEWVSPEMLKISGTGTHDRHGNIEAPSYEEVVRKSWQIIE